MSKISLKKAVDILNDLFKKDRKAISKLVETEIKCNKKLKNHERIKVNKKIKILDIVNSFFELDQDDWGKIVLTYKKNGKIDKFIQVKEN